MFSDLGSDVRYSLRMLTKSPGVTALAILTLALGIAVNVTIFSYVNALLLRPPAGVPSPNRLVEVWQQNKKAAGIERFLPFTYPDYLYYRDHAHVFSGMIAFDGDPELTIWNRAGNGETVQGQIVSGNFFSVLGVPAVLGRTLMPADDQPSAEPAVVISNSFWRTRLAADPKIVGQRLILNGVEYRVVGVLPAGFEGLEIALEPDFWVPISMTDKLKRDKSFLESWQSYWLFGVGRLKPGQGIAQARAEMSVIAGQLAQARPKDRKDIGALAYPAAMVPGPFRGYVGAFTGLLMAVVSLVLLIACTNAANLMLMRAFARRREMAIRAAMGASRGRLVRHILVESTLLAAMAGAVALVLAYWTAPLLMSLKPSSLPIKIEVPTDWRVVAFTVLASLLAGIVFGLFPALRSAKVDLTPALKSDSAGGGFQKSRLRGALVIAQVAACALLLVGAALCVRSLLNAQSIDPGFDVKHVAAATIDPGSVGYDEQQRRNFYDQMMARIENLPGVTAASWIDHLPLSAARESTEISNEGPSGKRTMSVDVLRIGTRYFETMGVPFSRGRDFTLEESKGNAKVVIINEAVAHTWWPGQDPVGQHIDMGGFEVDEIIGIVKTGKYRSLGEDPIPLVYEPIGSMPRATLVVRTANDPRSLLEPIRKGIQAVDPNLAATDIETLQTFMTLPLFPARVTGILLGAFGLLALALAMGGLYGVISYTMSQRTREIGLRMALGAGPRDVAALVLRYGLAMSGLGVVLGIALAFGATHVLSSLLYGIRADDPATLIGVSFVLIAVTLLACWLPARRAMEVDPMVALRYE
ncbi:MAG TPA: ABC transporter permease [Candidatus Acidoferrales bacterium]|nr:ABC transporter permease [Candidatus Acidoferrales bacterium]